MFANTLNEDGYRTSAQSWFPTGKKSGELTNGNRKVFTPQIWNQYWQNQGGAYEYFKIVDRMVVKYS